ncbi:MAG: hypothetical protein ABJO09_00845 [Hyphomicrobiales bacterium]
MQVRRFKADDYHALKSAVRRTRKLVGSRNTISEQTRVGGTQIANYEDAHQTECHVPIDVAMDIDELAGEAVILTQLAALQGYRLVPIGQSPTNMDIKDHIQLLCKEFGEAISAIGNGTSTPRQREEATKELLEVNSTVNAALRDLHAQDAQARG